MVAAERVVVELVEHQDEGLVPAQVADRAQQRREVRDVEPRVGELLQLRDVAGEQRVRREHRPNLLRGEVEQPQDLTQHGRN